MFKGFKQKSFLCFLLLVLLVPTSHASFIEATIGTAVVNDETTTYYNPAALTLLKKSQFVALSSLASARSQFTGQAIQAQSGFNLIGGGLTETKYFLPSLYFAGPISQKIVAGVS